MTNRIREQLKNRGGRYTRETAETQLKRIGLTLSEDWNPPRPMNIYPNPLLCLYCDARIVPNTAIGCRNHMLRCSKHPAYPLLQEIKQLTVIPNDNYAVERLAQIAHLCEP